MVMALIGIIAAANVAIGFTIVPTNKSPYSIADGPRWGNDNGVPEQNLLKLRNELFCMQRKQAQRGHVRMPKKLSVKHMLL